MIPKNIYEWDEVFEYLQKHQLIEIYKKTKTLLLQWSNTGAQFRKRNPKNLWIYYFRINQKYRAIWKFDENGNFRVATIDSHQ